MRTIAIVNQKGGCGKTTTAINLGAMLARAGKRVLLVDMDPQSHCAAGLGVPEGRIELDIGDAMLAVGHRPLDPPRLLWRVARNMDLAPSRMRLAGLEAARGGLAELLDKDRRLAAVLNHFRHDYDIACIDCAPSIGLLTYNALAASDSVLIPVETSFFSLQGATKQVNSVRTLARRLGVQLPTWVLATIHDENNGVAADLLAELHRRFKDRVVPVIVRRDARLKEAASFGQTIADYSPDSSGAADYALLATWVRELLDGKAEPPSAPEPEHHSDEHEAEVHVAAISPRFLAERPAESVRPAETPARSEVTQTIAVAEAPEVKTMSRAEDVARRAQEFLRRVALGRNTPAATGSPALASATGFAQSPLTASAAVAVLPAPALRLMEEPAARIVPASPSVSRLFGVQETNQGVLFVQPLTSGQRVAVAGSFNGWSTSTHELKRNVALGVFELCVRIPPGKVHYRLIIDGQWSADPYNNTCEPNPFGETNSVFHVGAPHAVMSVERSA
ncbi:Sporulation initiation inhibitor protein Soj [Phycisphaerales bacterium]|nr:Sporulation initiation inhibitor protein Soj [Phycisphaerales bacterium]